jgi:hypothetical protein
MPYVTTFERFGIKKGRKEGRREGRIAGRREGRREGRKEGHAEGLRDALREAVAAILKARFGSRGGQMLAKIELPDDPRELRRLLRGLLAAPSPASAATLLQRLAASR